MNKDRSAAAARRRPLRRRNRDHPIRAGRFAQPNASGERQGASASTPCCPAAQVLENGHPWLRFPDGLETRFQAQALEPRRQLVLFCGLIGVLAICLGSFKLTEMMPDAPEVALRNVYWILATCLSVQGLLWRLPARWRRPWQAELTTALPLLAVNAGVINFCVVSHSDAIVIHSAALVSTLMFGCIAARMRFAWSLGCAIISFAAYVAFVRGTTPQQELIVTATTGLMGLSYSFALLANYAFEYRERSNWLLRDIEQHQRDALEVTSAHLHRLSIQDPLTRLFNRRQFDSDLGMAWSKARFAKEPVAMLMVDVDFFKNYNDSYGHPAGDACLIQVAQALSTIAQAHEGIAARLGGEEFGLLLPHRTLAQAQHIGEALCEAVRRAGIAHRASATAPHVTVSIGAASLLPTRGSGAQSLMDLADQALYQAKTLGRDRTCSAHAPEAAPIADPTLADTADTGDMRADVIPLPPPADAVYTQILQDQFRTLRFPAEQEVAYRRHNADQRRTHLVSMAVLGLLIYNVYMVLNRSMYSDVQDRMLSWQIGLCACLLLIAGAMHVLRWPVLLCEALFGIGTAILAVITAWILSQSQQLTALAFSVCLVLIPMFSGVAARQPFWFTCVPAVITCVAVPLFLGPVWTQHSLVLADNVTMIATNTVFTLILAYTLERGTRKEWLLSQIGRLQAEALQVASRRLHELSMLDPLTGIRNRRQFEDDLQRIWAEGLQTRHPLAMLVIDVDFFKRFNDGYGHPEGDRCLKLVAQAIRQTADEVQGLAARLGGEEFGVLLPQARIEQARALGERICAAVRQMDIEHRHSLVPQHATVTVSVGVACLVADRRVHRRTLFTVADDALYLAKKHGRNRVAALEAPSPHRDQALGVA